MAPDCKMTFLYWSSLKSHLGYNVLTDLILKISFCILELITSLLSGRKKEFQVSHSLITPKWIATKYIIYYLYYAKHITFLKGSGRLLECRIVQGHTQWNSLFTHPLEEWTIHFWTDIPTFLKIVLTNLSHVRSWVYHKPMENLTGIKAIDQSDGLLWSQTIWSFWWTLGGILQDILCVFHSGLRRSTNPDYGMKMPFK